MSRSRRKTTEQNRAAKDDSLFWDQYLKEADLFDKELVKGLGGDLDTLLIFAGLFSAVNTAFIIESYQDLKPDPAESGGTNALLRILIQTIDNTTTAASAPDFSPDPHTIVINALFFISLCCSLLSAFGAVLAKQWLHEYERTGLHRIPYDRAHHRHAKYLGMQRYHCEMVTQALGTILQVALFLFLVALANWLWNIHLSLAVIAIVAVTVTFGFYITTTIISVYDSASPFSTRFSAFLRSSTKSEKAFAGEINETLRKHEMDETDGRCIAWVRDNSTMFESVVGMARAAARLRPQFRNELELGHQHVGPVLLQSLISSNAIPLGLVNGTLFATVNAIRDAMTSWKGVPISLACDVVAQLHQMLRLTVPKDPSLSESIVLTLQRFDLDVPRDMQAQTRRPEQEVLVDFIGLPSLTLEGKRAGLRLLWRYHRLSIFAPFSWGQLRNAGRPSFGSSEESWPWRVVDALLSATDLEDSSNPDMEQLEFFVTWAAVLGPGGEESMRMMYGDMTASSPGWILRFARPWSLVNHLLRHPRSSDFAPIKAAMDFLTHRTATQILNGSCTPYHTSCDAPELLSCGLIKTAFRTNQEFQPGYMAVLYWWFHIHEEHSDLSLPTDFVTRQYIRSAIFKFLTEQLGRDPWIPPKHVPFTVAAIRAFVAQFESLDSSQKENADPGDFRPLQQISSLLEGIRDGSYRFHGEGSVGQDLWDCFKLVVRALHPGEGIVRFKRLGLSGSEEYTIDWDEVEAVKILGMDSVSTSYGLPLITGGSFLGFDSY